MQFGVTVLLCPQIKRDGGQFVDQWIGEAALGEVDALDVGLAGVAALDADMGQLGGSVDGKLSVVFLTAAGTDEAAELPFGKTETAEQAAAASVALLAKQGYAGLAIAEWAQRVGVALDLQIGLGADEFGVRLKESEHEEFLRIGGGVDVGEIFGEEAGPGGGVGVAEVVGDLGERRRGLFF